MFLRSVTSFAVAALTVGTAICVPAFAQDGPKPSQLGSVTQQVNQTTLTVKYSRPVARGRALFGELVPWARIWTPGANDATTLTTSTDVRINGQKLPAGTYTIWSEPQSDQWSIIFNTAHPVFHTRHADVASQDLLKVAATPRPGAHMEALAWYFPVVDGRKAELVVHWGTVVVPLELDVP